MAKCKWCGSSRHKSKACSIQHKHQMLLDGVPLEKCGFDAVLDINFGNGYSLPSYWQNFVIYGL